MSDELRYERHAFVFITVILFPLLAVMLVGGLGFVIWISQMIFGPPVYTAG
ncbi:nitrate reductase [Alteromonas aestuariivivens]|uniref:Nitrate reductase n=1 Tax=Alteromonas aestuariivivens TaxID=1938339 RepID=A0A3D8M4C5_9ALTE|nr:periplasmic nitrate reductase, NapE protein [Alteromonas aestuariivivens]RDV24506.1 nitrate reductase [Alteromonas aestuariivivens]